MQSYLYSQYLILACYHPQPTRYIFIHTTYLHLYLKHKVTLQQIVLTTVWMGTTSQHLRCTPSVCSSAIIYSFYEATSGYRMAWVRLCGQDRCKHGEITAFTLELMLRFGGVVNSLQISLDLLSLKKPTMLFCWCFRR